MKSLVDFLVGRWQSFFPLELLSVLILSVALLVPTWLYIVTNSASDELHQTKQAAKIAVFLKIATTEKSALKLVKQINNYPAVQSVDFVSSAEAMQIFKHQSRLNIKLDFLNDKVLPPTLFVAPKPEKSTQLIKRLKAIEQVELVTLDSYWAGKLSALLSILDRLFIFVAWSFVLVFVAIVFFVTKVLLATVLNEIKLKLLLGSTHQKIIWHYVIKSVYLGVISALFSLLLTWSGVIWLDVPLLSFVSEFGINIGLDMLNLVECLVLIVISILLYSATAWVTCATILYQIDRNLEQADKF